MKTPGPDHPITVEQHGGRVRVRFGEHVVADTTAARVLREASYPPVYYVPRRDAHMDLLVRSTFTTHCPYKGDANYYSVQADGRTADNAVWTYEQPAPHVAAIEGHLAFYPDKVSIEVD
jgi:uncharacterized protein (DUF427 family)